MEERREVDTHTYIYSEVVGERRKKKERGVK